MEDLVRVARELGERAGHLSFGPPVAYVYNPLAYAWEPHERYLRAAAHRRVPILLLGMNPGPFGMMQTGVPFGEVRAVRGFLGVTGTVGRPDREHPKRPVLGFRCQRSEVSGRRLWGWAEQRFGTMAAFASRFFVWNYCPLGFLDEGGRNLTPDRLPARERSPLEEVCDAALRALVRTLGPLAVVGVGGFAWERAEAALGRSGIRLGTILHPSPASPAANRGWAETIEAQLDGLGIPWRPDGGTRNRAPAVRRAGAPRKGGA